MSLISDYSITFYSTYFVSVLCFYIVCWFTSLSPSNHCKHLFYNHCVVLNGPISSHSMNSGPEERPRTLWGTAHVLHQVQLLLCIMLYISLCFYSDPGCYSTKLLFILQVFIINFVVHNAVYSSFCVFLRGKKLLNMFQKRYQQCQEILQKSM